MTFVIGSAIGQRGDITTIDVVLQTAVDVFETQNDITLGPEIQVATAANGTPDCTVNPTIDMIASFTGSPARPAHDPWLVLPAVLLWLRRRQAGTPGSRRR
jgi:hypothetical protein